MGSAPKHIQWLIDTKRTVKTSDGKLVSVLELQHKNDDAVISEWAKHFRNHYCLDTDIDALRNGTGKNRKEYLEQIKFPDPSAAPGPSIRSGDFGEILVADYLEYILNYWVPRTRYNNKTVRNESEKGCDVIGFRVVKTGTTSENDELIIFETKAKLTGKDISPRLQDAIEDSAKDIVRKAEALNAIKQRFIDRSDTDSALRVERFQNAADSPYRETNGAAAVLTKTAFDDSVISKADASNHPNSGRMILVVIYGEDLMTLANALYRKAADEA